ncbi:MAG: DUF2007 domain-containing protein [Dehalobacter sp.]|nr:DUF2007 domain-containing protein [Dehalobacter sp.]
MPWCPNCRYEYRDGFDTCIECDSKLVETLEPIKKEEIEHDKESYLMSVTDGVEAGFIEAILNTNNIPVLKKYRSTGAYLELYLGMSGSGVDIYVPSKLSGQAKELVTGQSDASDELCLDISSEEINGFKKAINRKRKFRAWVVILVFITPGLIAAIITAVIIILSWIHK